MLTIIDAGYGNIRSVEKAFQAVGAEVRLTTDPGAVRDAERLVLPGVGAFRACMDALRALGLEQPVHDFIDTGRPFLGVCVGMQMLFEYGEEMGIHPGLGVLPGRVVRFSGPEFDTPLAFEGPAVRDGSILTAPERLLKVPHMGWNRVIPTRTSPLFLGLPDEAWFYFVHSFHATTPAQDVPLGNTRYGVEFPSVVGRGNIFGVQFHPEKSQRNGLTILKNFSTLAA